MLPSQLVSLCRQYVYTPRTLSSVRKAPLMVGLVQKRSVDELLKGGLREGQHTELVGESGTGKTQVRTAWS